MVDKKLGFIENKCLQEDFCNRSFSVVLKQNGIDLPVPMVISSPQKDMFFLIATPLPHSAMTRLFSTFVIGSAVGVKPWKQIIPWEVHVTDETFWKAAKEAVESYMVPDLFSDEVIKQKVSQYKAEKLKKVKFIPDRRYEGGTNPFIKIRTYKEGIVLVSYRGEPVLFAKTPTGELIATLTDSPLSPRTGIYIHLFTGVILPPEDSKKVELLSPKVLQITDKTVLRSLRIGLERWVNYAEKRYEEYLEDDIIDRIYPIYHLMYPEL